MADDPLVAELASIRERTGKRGELAASMAVAAVDARDWYETTDHVADDVPRLLAAVEAVLARHVPFDGHAETCCAHDGFDWPCATHRDIAAALIPEGEDSA